MGIVANWLFKRNLAKMDQLLTKGRENDMPWAMAADGETPALPTVDRKVFELFSGLAVHAKGNPEQSSQMITTGMSIFSRYNTHGSNHGLRIVNQTADLARGNPELTTQLIEQGTEWATILGRNRNEPVRKATHALTTNMLTLAQDDAPEMLSGVIETAKGVVSNATSAALPYKGEDVRLQRITTLIEQMQPTGSKAARSNKASAPSM